MQKRSLCAIAVLATFGLTTGAMADVQINDQNKAEYEAKDAMEIGYGELAGTTVQNFAASVHLKKVVFTGTDDPSGQNKKKGYLKNWNGALTLDELTVNESVQGAIEYWGTSDESAVTGVSYDVGTANVGKNAVLFVQTSQDKKGNDFHDHLIDDKSSLHIGTLNMASGSKLLLGYTNTEQNTGGGDETDTAAKNKIGAAHQAIDTINAGMEENPTGTVTISANVNPTLYVQTINVGGVTLDMSGAEHDNVKQSGVNLVGSVMVNLQAAGSKVEFGTIGGSTDFTLPDHTPSTKSLLAEGEAASAGTPTTVVINYSEAAFTGTADVEFAQSSVSAGSTIRATASGDLVGTEVDGKALTAQDVANKLVDKTFGTQQSSVVGDGITTQVEVTAAGIQDGVIYDVVAPAEGSSETGPVLGNEYTVENDVTSSLSQLAAVGFMQWRAEMNDMQHRLGEVRDHQGLNNGAWARAFQGKDEYGSKNIENDYYGVQVGYDHKIEGTNVLLGGAFSYTHGDSEFDVGEGDNYTYALTAYGTWLAENGMFVDGTLKYGRLSSDVDLATAQSGKLLSDTMDYDTQAMSASIEAGWRFPVASFAYIEPQLEVMYGHIWSDNASWNDIDVTVESADTLVGRAGFMAGLTCPNKKGGAYLRASVLHDWEGDADTTFRQGGDPRTLTEELGDTWYELGVGAHWNVTDTTYIYGDFEYAGGGEIDTPWKYSIGVRHAF